jgi:hypothetical protein
MLSGDANRGNILQRCHATKQVHRKYGNDVEGGVVTLSKAFHYEVAQMISLFQDYLDNPCQFHSVKDSYTNWPRRVSVAGQQHDIDSFVVLVKRIAAFPATECACERLFCQLGTLAGDFRRQMSDSMIADPLVIKTRIIWHNAA